MRGRVGECWSNVRISWAAWRTWKSIPGARATIASRSLQSGPMRRRATSAATSCCGGAEPRRGSRSICRGCERQGQAKNRVVSWAESAQMKR